MSNWCIIKKLKNHNKNTYILVYIKYGKISTWEQVIENDRCMKKLSKIILQVTKKPYMLQFNRFIKANKMYNRNRGSSRSSKMS